MVIFIRSLRYLANARKTFELADLIRCFSLWYSKTGNPSRDYGFGVVNDGEEVYVSLSKYQRYEDVNVYVFDAL